MKNNILKYFLTFLGKKKKTKPQKKPGNLCFYVVFATPYGAVSLTRHSSYNFTMQSSWGVK